MSANAAIEGLSIPQKLQLMEAIWDDLCRSESDLASPAWHAQVLTDRQARVDRGEARFIDWETAKARIREAVR